MPLRIELLDVMQLACAPFDGEDNSRPALDRWVADLERGHRQASSALRALLESDVIDERAGIHWRLIASFEKSQ